MTMLRLNSTRDLLDLQGEVNRLFGGGVGAAAAPPGSAWRPAVDVHETAAGFTLQMDLPGIKPEEVKIKFVDGTLTIDGERRIEAPAEDAATFHRTERSGGTFRRSFTLRTPIAAPDIRATYRDGVLEIFVPRAEEAKPREIRIQVA